MEAWRGGPQKQLKKAVTAETWDDSKVTGMKHCHFAEKQLRVHPSLRTESLDNLRKMFECPFSVFFYFF